VKPPHPPPPPKVIDVLNIVEDDVELDEELVIEDTEATEDMEVDFSNMQSEEEEEAAVFFIVEDMPIFPGGDAALHKYLATAQYPIIAQENGIQGRVYVKFVINTDGSVTDVQIARGVDPSLDKEALRVVKNMPKWKPGKQRGQAVRVSYTVPINFVLQ
jgi:protein TonB